MTAKLSPLGCTRSAGNETRVRARCRLDASSAVTPALSSREVEVLRLLAVGDRDKDIAAKLGISYRTVHHHVERIFRKIQVSSRAAATAYAVDNGLVARGSL